jgi:antitoxin (DNA-binding transcriptional repressor) of toxin-antitoxin stability system
MKHVLKAIERGETIIVLYRGKPIARILPLDRKRTDVNLLMHPAYGMWKDRKDLRDVSGYVRKLRQARLPDL